MNNVKKVLIPTDFSDNAWDALTYAIRLYDDIPCKFYILNTFLVGASHTSTIQNQARNTHLYRAIHDDSVHELDKIKNFLTKNLLNDKHEYITLSKAGILYNVVKNIILTENIDIVIMGTTGASGLKEVFMGSNTVKMINQINLCPILSVPKKYEYKEIEQVIFATGYKRNFNKNELHCLRELQLIHNFHIHVVHIVKEGLFISGKEANIAFLKEFIGTENLSFEEIDITNGHISDIIEEYADKHEAHLICLLKYEHNIFELITHEPVIKKISFHSNIPLLILPA